MATEDTEFDDDQIKNEIKEALDKVTEDKRTLHSNNFKEFSRQVLDEVFKEILKKKRMFKYSVTVFLQQKNGAAMTYGCSMYVDNTADGSVAFPYREHEYFDLMVCVAGYKITQK